MHKELAKISKFLSYVLRHKPDSIGLELDVEGWASISDLINKADIPITRELLNTVISTNDKQRFAISKDGLFIRANQGHSLNIDLKLHPLLPPELLYHGTATCFLASIKEKGLVPKNRQYVHLSGDEETATKVGQRHGKPVVFKIHARTMHKQGYEFFQAQNGVWLTDMVPAGYISGST